MQKIYRIYDTVEKRYRDDMFVDAKGALMIYDYDLIKVVDDVVNIERYIVELCVGDVGENDLINVSGYVEGFFVNPVTIYRSDEEKALGCRDNRYGWHNIGTIEYEIVGCAHLLEDK